MVVVVTTGSGVGVGEGTGVSVGIGGWVGVSVGMGKGVGVAVGGGVGIGSVQAATPMPRPAASTITMSDMGSRRHEPMQIAPVNQDVFVAIILWGQCRSWM